jgi:hypothetical protein
MPQPWVSPSKPRSGMTAAVDEKDPSDPAELKRVRLDLCSAGPTDYPWEFERDESSRRQVVRAFLETPGKPLHPPLTDASIGARTAGVVMLVLGALSVEEEQMAHGALLAISLGLVLAQGPV